MTDSNLNHLLEEGGGGDIHTHTNLELSLPICRRIWDKIFVCSLIMKYQSQSYVDVSKRKQKQQQKKT